MKTWVRWVALFLGLGVAVRAQLVAPPTVDWVSLPGSAPFGSWVWVGAGAHANLSDNSDGGEHNAASPGGYQNNPLVVAALNIFIQAPGQTDWTQIHGWMDPWQTPAEAWASFNVSQAGTYTVRIGVMDGRPWFSPDYYYTISVPTPQPAITSQLSVAVNEGQNVYYQITATNSPTSFAASNLPAGLSLNTSSGVISGRITAASNVSSTISAYNGAGSDTQTLVWNVTAAYIVANGSVSPNPIVYGSSVTLTRDGWANFGLGWTQGTIWKPNNTLLELPHVGFGSTVYTPDGGPGTYWWQYRVVDSNHNHKEQWISFTVSPVSVTAPTSFSASPAGSTFVALSWSGASANVGIARYDVYRNGSLLTSTTGTSYTDSNVSPLSNYNYNVVVVDTQNNTATSNTLSVTAARALEVFAPLR